MNIVEFIEARIAEDEETARLALSDLAGEHWRSYPDDPDDTSVDSDTAPVADAETTVYAPHIARWDPARVLAECAAKRAILEECKGILGVGGWEYDDAPELATMTLRALAAVYRDHPDYLQDWNI